MIVGQSILFILTSHLVWVIRDALEAQKNVLLLIFCFRVIKSLRAILQAGVFLSSLELLNTKALHHAVSLRLLLLCSFTTEPF